MSTKSTLVRGPGFELSTDLLFDHSGQGEVTLFIYGPGVNFEASVSGGSLCVSLTISRAVWHVLRQHGEADLSMVDLTDDDLRRMATEMVRRRMDDLAGEPKNSILRIIGMGYMGSDEDPSDVQEASAFEEMVRERAAQRGMAEEIRRLAMGEEGADADR